MTDDKERIKHLQDIIKEDTDEILRLRAENEKLRAENEKLVAQSWVVDGALLSEREESEKLRAALKLIAETYNKPTTSKDGLAFIAAAALKETSNE